MLGKITITVVYDMVCKVFNGIKSENFIDVLTTVNGLCKHCLRKIASQACFWQIVIQWFEDYVEFLSNCDAKTEKIEKFRKT